MKKKKSWKIEEIEIYVKLFNDAKKNVQVEYCTLCKKWMFKYKEDTLFFRTQEELLDFLSFLWYYH